MRRKRSIVDRQIKTARTSQSRQVPTEYAEIQGVHIEHGGGKPDMLSAICCIIQVVLAALCSGSARWCNILLGNSLPSPGGGSHGKTKSHQSELDTFPCADKAFRVFLCAALRKYVVDAACMCEQTHPIPSFFDFVF